MAKETSPQASVSIHRSVSLDFVRNSGGYAVRVKRGEKVPVESTDWRGADATKSENILRELANTDENVGLHLFDNLVDIDIDSDDPNLKAALDEFMPPCSHIWGRPSRPRTHRVYAIRGEPYDPSSFPFFTRLHASKNGERVYPEVNVELRGGQKSRGVYSLLPGSVLIPKAKDKGKEMEEYLWADLNRARSSPSTTDIQTLVSAIRMAGAVALMAPYWVEGSRHQLCLALSGLLHRIATYAKDLEPDSMFRMDKDHAERILRAVIKVAGDDESDMVARMKSFESTWAKGNKGFKTTGGATIDKLTGNTDLKKKLYFLLSEVSALNEIDWFTSKFAIWQGPGLVLDMEGEGIFRDPMTRTQFCNSYGHKKVTADNTGPLIADLMFSMGSAQRVIGLTFDPSDSSRVIETPAGDVLNQWTGFAIPPAAEPVTDEEVRPFLEYVREVLGGGNPEQYEWVMSWVAHIFKEPSNKCRTALVLIGLPGVGKSFIGHNFIRPIIGDNHSTTFDSVDKLTGTFNADSDNKLFVQLDEATNNRQHVAAGRLKTMITDKTVRIEPKFVNAYQKPNHRRFLFTSNDDDAIFIPDGADDRRYTVLRISDRWLGRTKEDKAKNREERWTPLGEWAKDKGNLAKVHRWLLDYAYNRSVIEAPLETSERISMGQHSMPAFDRWLARWVTEGHPLSIEAHRYWHDAPIGENTQVQRDMWPSHVNMTTLCADYARFVRSVPGRDKETQINAWHIREELKKRNIKSDGKPKRLKEVSDPDKRTDMMVRKRPRVHPIPTKEEIDKYLQFRYGASYLTDDVPEAPFDDEAGEF